ncbi:GerAB/ArcD/ProY family transporter [Paenibacillus abyssi]|uniref:Germination protein n=1 Tax=Paenibacillus abyssi TaxID=1340531 RepID=A0A917D0J6_9BACL|nr:GerAB/ArcD/ProY family transporter [Paenibacillus abyssi]GGG06124.1 germination protein [Paenibacillus abyssi]
MREKINPYHIFMLMYMVQSGVGLFSLPRITAEYFGTNGWLAVLVVSFIVCLNIALFYIVYRMGKGRSVFDIMESSVSKFVLFPLYAFVIFVISLTGCLLGKQYILMFQMISFQTTPPYILKLFFEILLYFLLIKGIYNIVKASTVFFYLTSWMPFLMLYHLGEFEWQRLTPFLFQGETSMIQGIIQIMGSLLGYEVSLYLIPYVERNSPFFRAVVLGSLYTSLVYLVVCIVSFGFFGFTMLLHLNFPLFDLFAFIELPFVERFENLLFIFFIFKVLITTIISFWIVQLYLGRIFTKAHPKLLIFMIVLATYIVSNFADTLTKLSRWLHYLFAMHISLNFLIPIVLIILLNIQKRQEVT